MTNLEKIDYACVMTKRRYESYYNNDQKMNEHLVQALTNALKLNYSGFTRENNARSEIMTLSKEELEAELLKNLIRTVSYKRSTNDPEYMKGMSSSLNQMNEQMPLPIIENTLYNSLLELNSHVENNGMERGEPSFQLMNQPQIQKAMVESFIHNRYDRNINVCLEENNLSNIEMEIIDSLDAYLLRNQNGYHI